MTKIYPSSSAFMTGPLVSTTSNKSCLRYLSAVAHSNLSRDQLFTAIAPEYQAIGALDEHLYSFKLDKQGVKYEREVPFKIDFKGVTISGRMDFVLEDGTVVEKKSTTSANVYKRVFENGQPEPSHMAQLVSYLAFLKQPVGKLVITYWEIGEDLLTYEIVAEKEFIVRTLDTGSIMLGQDVYQYTVRDLARWYSLAVIFLTEGGIGQKPYQSTSKYESPCNFCPLKKVCDKTDSGTTFAEYMVDAIPALLDKTPPRAFKVSHNTKRRQGNRKKKNETQSS